MVGLELGEPLPLPEATKAAVQARLPPPTGYGSDEDSLQSYYHLSPKPPRKDFRKMMEFERRVLRFLSRLISSKPEDAERRFVITYFLADDNVMVGGGRRASFESAEGV
jgi:EF-hand domain-containing protein 1